MKVGRLRGDGVCLGMHRCMANARQKILCIEDDDETAALIAEELIERGFEVVVAHSGWEGLQALMRSPTDLVLCDIGMPVMTGFEVLQSLKELGPRFSKIPLIFLTALTSRDDELKGRRLGADDYVTKPIDFDRLVAIIQSRLAGVARTQPSAARAVLNERQIQILTLVALGNTSVQIGQKLRLSKRTVDFHINNARIKLRATTRAEAAIKAVAAGLIKPEDDR
jgi:DNA-binding response OmpR family regulator